MLTLSNPAGLWALLGIPAVLAIHFLQRQAVVLPISTLFLLEKTQRESASGRKFDRLMNSVPLWMQLLGVLLLAWLLAEPRYAKEKSTQRVAVVLDSSASMSVFKDSLIEKLAASLPDLQGPATDLELTLLESTPGRGRLYSGASTDEFLAALREWHPRDGMADPSHSLRLARSLVSRDGVVVYATDTPLDTPPFDARLLSVGEKIDNAGFTGCTIATEEGALVFRATVKNYSERRTSRAWHIQLPDGSRTEPRPLELDPGAIVTIQASFPAGANRLILHLDPDAFTADDSLPLVAPRPKELALFTATSGAFEDLTQRLLRSLEAIEPVNDAASADLALLAYDPLDPVTPTGNAAIFVRDDTQGGAYLRGGIVAEKHPLIDALNWQSLLVRETIQLERRSSDTVLLWQGQRPLIFLRDIEAAADTPAAQQLCFNFDLRLSNAATQPAFIVMFHRFAAALREAKVAAAAENLETGQPFELAARSGAGPLTLESRDLAGKTARRELPAAARSRIEAPRDPGYLRILQGGDELLEAAVHFADTREADFSACEPADTLGGARGATIDRHTEEDHWWRLWFLLLITALIIAWHFTREREAPGKPATKPVTS